MFREYDIEVYHTLMTMVPSKGVGVINEPTINLFSLNPVYSGAMLFLDTRFPKTIWREVPLKYLY